MKKFWDFLKSSKWVHLIYLISVIGFFAWLILKDQSCQYDKKKGFIYDSKSKVNVNINK